MKKIKESESFQRLKESNSLVKAAMIYYTPIISPELSVRVKKMFER